MEQKLDRLLEDMLEKTRHLVQIVEQTDSDPDVWMTILDEREKLIRDAQVLLAGGNGLTAHQKQQMEKIHELNLLLMPKMEQRKQTLKKKLDDIRRSKAARRFYNKNGHTAYGAFFDRKK